MVVGVDHEQLAAGAVLPPQAQVAAERIAGRVVLHEPAEKHARAERVVHPHHRQVRLERPVGRVDPVEGNVGLHRHLRQHRDATLRQFHRGQVALEVGAASQRDLAVDPPLPADGIGHLNVGEAVATCRDREIGTGRNERLDKQLIAVGRREGQSVAGLELGLEGHNVLSRLQVVPVGRQDVIDAALQAELPDVPDRPRPGAEATRGEGAPEVVAPQEAYLRQEVILHHQVIHLKTVAVRRVLELALVAQVLPPVLGSGEPGPGNVGSQIDILEEGEGAVDAVGLAGARRHPGDGAVGEDRTDRAAAQDVTPETEDGEVGRFRPGNRLVPRVDVQGAHIELPDLARQARAADNGHHAALLQPDPPAVEELRHVDGAEEPAGRLGARPADGREGATGEAEDATSFEKELPLLRKEQGEAGQVDLALVHLHLREVRVVGEVGGQVPGDAVLHVDAAVDAHIVDLHGGCGQVRGQAADDIRFDLEAAARRRRLQANQRAGLGDAEHPAGATAESGRDGQRRQIGPLVLAPDGAPELDAPDMRRLRPVAQGLERNLHLYRPAAVEAAGSHVPHRVPVRVRVALVNELCVCAGAERIGVEEDSVAAVVERIEQHGEGVVLTELVGVAPHLVGDPLALGRRVPDPRRDVDAGLVEKDPGLGPLGRLRSRVGRQLNEAADGGNRPVNGLIQHAVEVDALVQPDRANRRPALIVAGHYRRRNGSRRTVNHCRIDLTGGVRLPGRRLPRKAPQQKDRHHHQILRLQQWSSCGRSRRRGNSAEHRRPHRWRGGRSPTNVPCHDRNTRTVVLVRSKILQSCRCALERRWKIKAGRTRSGRYRPGSPPPRARVGASGRPPPTPSLPGPRCTAGRSRHS